MIEAPGRQRDRQTWSGSCKSLTSWFNAILMHFYAAESAPRHSWRRHSSERHSANQLKCNIDHTDTWCSCRVSQLKSVCWASLCWVLLYWMSWRRWVSSPRLCCKYFTNFEPYFATSFSFDKNTHTHTPSLRVESLISDIIVKHTK